MDSNCSSSKIPVINCINISDGAEQIFDRPAGESLKKFATEFGQGLSEIGFVYLSNHGIDVKKVNKIYEVSRVFFNLPPHIKNEYRKVDPTKCYHGYSGPGSEYTSGAIHQILEMKESWDIAGSQAYDESKFPTQIHGFKAAFDDFRAETKALIQTLLVALGIYLDLENPKHFLDIHRGFFDPTLAENQAQIRSLNYFPLNKHVLGEQQGDKIRCGEHTDWGTLTLNFQDMIGGLEIQNVAGEWISADPIENTILVHGGNLLETWSDGRIRAAKHRVQIPSNEAHLQIPRQTVIYFIVPDDEAKVVQDETMVAVKKKNPSSSSFFSSMIKSVDKNTTFREYSQVLFKEILPA